MLSVVCFDLITEAIHTDINVMTIIISVAFGVAIIFLLNYLRFLTSMQIIRKPPMI